MKYLFLLALLFLILIGVIYLKPPPTPDTGVDAEINIKTNLVQTSPNKKLSIKGKLKDIKIPYMEFQEAPIREVINKIRKEAKSRDPLKKGINIVYLPKGSYGYIIDEENDDGFGLDNSEKQDEKVDPPFTMTFKFNDLSVGEVIRYLCIAADMKYKVEDHAVVIADKDVPFEGLETRIYPIELEIDLGISEEEEDTQINVKSFFENRGVKFPEGSKMIFDSLTYRLIARNSHEQLEQIENILVDLGEFYPDVLITARFVKLPEAEYKKLKDTEELTVWDQVIRSDKTEMMCSATIVTENGEEGMVRFVQEIYFPDCWYEEDFETEKDDDKESEKDEKISEKKEKSGHKTIQPGMMPQFGEAEEMGLRFTSTPTVDPDDYSITLDLIPVIQNFTGWLNYNHDIKMAIIQAMTVNSQITLYDGSTIPMGTTFEDYYNKSTGKREKNRWILLISARLLKPDGTPYHEIKNELNPIPKKKRKSIVKKSQPKKEVCQNPVLDDINFQNAGIIEVIEKLNAKVKEKENIHIVLGIDGKKAESIPRFSLCLNNIPFREVLRYINIKTGLEFCIDGNVVIAGDYNGTFDTKFYKLRNALVRRILNNTDSDDDITENKNDVLEISNSYLSFEGRHIPRDSKVLYDTGKRLFILETNDVEIEKLLESSRVSDTSRRIRNYFNERGVPFPPGAYLKYNYSTGKLRVRNTKESLRQMDTLLRPLSDEVPQVYIDSTIVEIGNKELIKLIGKNAALSDNMSDEQIQKIIGSEKSRILSSQSVVSRNGEEANIRLVNETYYPETWTSPEIYEGERHIIEVPAIPEFSEATDVNSTLTVTPTVSPDGKVVSLSIDTNFISFAGWSRYPTSYSVDTGKEVITKKREIIMPVRENKSIYQTLKFYDGNTLMVARIQQMKFADNWDVEFDPNKTMSETLEASVKDSEERINIFFFVKVNIINKDGTLLRK